MENQMGNHVENSMEATICRVIQGLHIYGKVD